MKINRHQIRESAFQVLFAKNANKDGDLVDIKDQVLEQYDTTEQDTQYLNYLIDGVLEHEDDLKAQISSKLKKGWSITRLTNPDLIILELGTFELTDQNDTPDNVVINESIELAKTFADDNSRKFINGVLSKIADEH